MVHIRVQATTTKIQGCESWRRKSPTLNSISYKSDRPSVGERRCRLSDVLGFPYGRKVLSKRDAGFENLFSAGVVDTSVPCDTPACGGRSTCTRAQMAEQRISLDVSDSVSSGALVIGVNAEGGKSVAYICIRSFDNLGIFARVSWHSLALYFLCASSRVSESMVTSNTERLWGNTVAAS